VSAASALSIGQVTSDLSDLTFGQLVETIEAKVLAANTN